MVSFSIGYVGIANTTHTGKALWAFLQDAMTEMRKVVGPLARSGSNSRGRGRDGFCNERFAVDY